MLHIFPPLLVHLENIHTYIYEEHIQVIWGLSLSSIWSHPIWFDLLHQASLKIGKITEAALKENLSVAFFNLFQFDEDT